MKYLKLILAMLLLLCLAKMPYGYYELVRYLAATYFAWMALQSHKQKADNWAFAYAALAILFQPLLKITLNRDIWNVIDVIIAAGLIFMYVRSLKMSGKN